MKPLDIYQLKKQMATLLPSSDVAEAFGRTQMTIFNWRTSRGLPYLSLAGSRPGRRPIILFEKSQVMRWARQRKIPLDESKLVPEEA